MATVLHNLPSARLFGVAGCATVTSAANGMCSQFNTSWVQGGNMSSAIAIWAVAVATADSIAKIIATIADAATPGRVLKATVGVAANSDGTTAAAASGPGQARGDVVGRASAGATAP